MAVEVNTLSEIVDFSKMDDKEKEEFCDRIITKQIALATRLAEIFDDEQLEETFLMEFVHRANIVKILAGRLSGEMNEKEIIEKFLEMMDEKFNNFFCSNNYLIKGKKK